MGLFNLFKKAVNIVVPETFDTKFDDIVDAACKEYNSQTTYFWGLKTAGNRAYEDQLLKLSDKQKVDFIVFAVQKIHNFYKVNKGWSSDDESYKQQQVCEVFIRGLLRGKMVLEDADIISILESFQSYPRYVHSSNITLWPVNLLIGQAEKQFKASNPSERLSQQLKELSDILRDNKINAADKESIKLRERIESILHKSQNGENAIRAVWFPGNDDFQAYANGVLKNIKSVEQAHWFRLMALSQKASGGTPSKKYLDEAKDLFKDLGAESFKKLVNEWFVFLIALKEKTFEHQYGSGGVDRVYTTIEFLAAPNIDMIKGFVWMCVHFHDKTTLFNIAALAERSYRKIPGKGPAAASIGNACLYVLANSRGLDGVGHLSRLKMRIKQNSTQNLIEKYLNAAAKEQGVSIHEIEDMAVDDYGLVAGEKAFLFDDYKAVLRITGIGKSEIAWYKPDGSPQKSVPAFVKDKHANKLKKLKDTAKQVDLSTTAQRDRIDRLFKSKRVLTRQQFHDHYWEHGLMRFIAEKLIWIFDNGSTKEAALFCQNAWINPDGILSLDWNEETKISLWHPVQYTVDNVRQWRDFLLEKKIVQPVKQAFREVYLLTDAEINTRTYSNRMAAHLLKQHQFNSLAKIRGWKYSLLGAYDDGRYNEAASLHLTEYGLTAEFWVNEVNADDAFNETGIWLYVATDQIRFVKAGTSDIVDLIEVPAVVLSEVMRDVDLFVGVASVGNDPAWRDTGGLVEYRDYWQAYSFGDLNEVAKTRKLLLEKLVPRLKIANVTEIRDKFLIVKGKLRTYKIHIGSTNILMEPNDQYLCIVPDRSTKPVTENLFLPFEGDNGISIILSKAMLLAEDDKITDTTITRQINH
jgi:hypothetical protein